MGAESTIYSFVTKGTLVEVLFGVMFLAFAYGMFLGKRLDQRFSQRLFLGYSTLQILALVFVFTVQWVEWHKPDCGIACQYFFPPHSNYYFNEVIVRWTSSVAFNATVGLVGGLMFSLFARLTRGRIIDQLDVDLLTVGGMVAGWPNILVFYGAVFMLTVILTLARALKERAASVRMIITPVLPFAAALVAVFGDQLARLVHVYEIGLTIV